MKRSFKKGDRVKYIIHRKEYKGVGDRVAVYNRADRMIGKIISAGSNLYRVETESSEFRQSGEELAFGQQLRKLKPKTKLMCYVVYKGSVLHDIGAEASLPYLEKRYSGTEYQIIRMVPEKRKK